MSDPDQTHTRKSSVSLGTPSGTGYFYDRKLLRMPMLFYRHLHFLRKTVPSQIQIAEFKWGRKAIDPPGQAKQDWWIIQEIANRMGLNWNYSDPSSVFAEMHQMMPSLNGITWERLLKESAVTYPCADETSAGESIIFSDGYPNRFRSG